MFKPFFSRLSDKKKVQEPEKKIMEPRGCRPRKEKGTNYYEIVCPFCLERSHIWEQQFRARSVSGGDDGNGQKGYPREKDQLYVDFWNRMGQAPRDPMKNHVLDINNKEDVIAVKPADTKEWVALNTDEDREKIKKKVLLAVRDKFGRETNRKLCPRCHNELPNAIGQYPNYIFTLMGNTFSGKTVYMDRLLLGLLNDELLPQRQLVVDVVGEDRVLVRQRLEKEFTSHVQRQGDEPEEEQNPEFSQLPGATPIKYKPPMILDVQNGQEHVLISLYDFPGEAIWNSGVKDGEDATLGFFTDLMNKMNENTNGWIFVLDCTTLECVRQLILEKGEQAFIAQKNLNDPHQNAKPSEVLLSFAKWMGDNNQINVPVALVLSKTDMISRYTEDLISRKYRIEENSLFLQENDSPARQCVDVDQLWKCHEQILNFLDGDQAVRTANSLCPLHGWFAVSATGAPVRNGVPETNASSRRITDPLEWLLWIDSAYPGVFHQSAGPWLKVKG